MAHGPSPDRVNSPHGPCHTATSSRIWDEAVAEPHNAFEMRTQTFEVGARPKTDYMMHTRPIQATSQLRCADVQQGRARWLTSAAQLHYERGISFARSKNTLVCRRCRSISDGLNSLPSSAFVLEFRTTRWVAESADSRHTRRSCFTHRCAASTQMGTHYEWLTVAAYTTQEAAPLSSPVSLCSNAFGRKGL